MECTITFIGDRKPIKVTDVTTVSYVLGEVLFLRDHEPTVTVRAGEVANINCSFPPA